MRVLRFQRRPDEAEQVHRRADPGDRQRRRSGKVADLCRVHGITEQTYYRWKAKYGGMELSEMQRLKALEDENRRLKQIVAEQTLDIQALKAVVAKKW
jgi:putative transposase